MGKIYAAKINHMTNPMGFLMERTVFSWKVKDCRGKEQKWARIVVAEDASFEKTVCDTGEADLDSRAARLSLKMKPCSRYYWKVTVATDADEIITSALSKKSSAEDGLEKKHWQLRYTVV